MDAVSTTAGGAYPHGNRYRAVTTSQGWTDERLDAMKKMWLDGMSATDIAGELGHGITRNAVIGKVHRLGLSGRAKVPAASQCRPKSRPTSRRLPRVTFKPQPQPHISGEANQPEPVAAVPLTPESVLVTISDLKTAMCRWPIGDPRDLETFRYCGGKSHPEESYCAFHKLLAYQPAVDRRARQKQAAKALLSAA